MRLIDADELKKHIRRCDDSATRVTFDYVDEDDIDDAPTIDVLDKIRAEIEQNAYPIVHGVNNHEQGMTVYGIMQIIDKYMK